MIIDAHAHLCHNPRGLDEVAGCGRLEQVWLMDVSGCALQTNPFASAAEVLRAAKDFPGFFVPFGYLDLRQGPDVVDRLKDQGFVGLKAYRPAQPYDHPDYFPHYERAAALKMPILFHTGLLEKCPIGKLGPDLSYGPNNMKPTHLATIAAAFPTLTLIGGHLGYPWLEETAQSLYYYPNIYHDLSGYRKDVEWLIKNLDRKCADGAPGPRRYFNDKILFATDALCYGDEKGHADAFKLMDFWSLFLEMVGGNYYRWGEPEERAKIMGGNARKLMETIQ